jgi:dTDP-4-dehydrorhamnose reductase
VVQETPERGRDAVKVAIIGSKGQLGSDLICACPSGVDLIGLTRNELDITLAAQIHEVLNCLKPDVIINTAAQHKPEEDNAELYFKVNAIAVRDLANAAKEIGATIVHISTDYVFDGKQPWDSSYSEDAKTNPLNTYGVSKAAGETYLRNILPQHYIVRVASLYGQTGASGKSGGNFVNIILNKAKLGEPLKVIDDIRMSPTCTLDAAKGIWKLLEGDYSFGNYHLTNAGACTWFEFARKIVELSGESCEVIPVPHTAYPSKICRPLNSALKNTKGPALTTWQDSLKYFLESV